MSDLVFISFPSEAKAEEVRQKILDMQSDYLIEVGDAVIATKDEKGRVKLNQLVHTTAIGATGGAFWGLLVGWIFLMPLAGAAIGAASPGPSMATAIPMRSFCASLTATEATKVRLAEEYMITTGSPAFTTLPAGP